MVQFMFYLEWVAAMIIRTHDNQSSTGLDSSQCVT